MPPDHDKMPQGQSRALGSDPEFMFAMGELSGQVRALTLEMTQFRNDRVQERGEILAAQASHDKRIKHLEEFHWKLIGMATIGAGAITLIIEVVFKA